MNPGILVALSSALAYGAADFIGGVGSRRYSSWQVVLAGQAAGALVILVAGLMLPGNLATPDFAWALLAGAGSATGSIFLFRGLARGTMGLVAPISAGLGQPWRPCLGVLGWAVRPVCSAPRAPSHSWSLPQRPASGIAGVLASLYPAVTVLLAAGVLGERISTGQRTGIATAPSQLPPWLWAESQHITPEAIVMNRPFCG